VKLAPTISSVAIGALTLAACGGDDSATPYQALLDGSVSDGAVGAGETGAGDANPVTRPPPLRTGPVDRAGRTAVIRLLVTETAKNDAGAPLASKIAYNQLDVFTGSLNVAFQADFQKNLVALDMFDGTSDWDGGTPEGTVIDVPRDAGPDADGGTVSQRVYTHPLHKLLQLDALLVDPNKPFSPSGYLDIENAAIVGHSPGSHLTCGGLWLGDDAVDKMLSFVVKGTTSGVSDGVGEATKTPSFEFPYLASAN
jgi:hypothetical protein